MWVIIPTKQVSFEISRLLFLSIELHVILFEGKSLPNEDRVISLTSMAYRPVTILFHNVQYHFRLVRSTILTIIIAPGVLIVMIYLVAKTHQKYKQRRNLVVIAPLIMAHYPYLNNLQFNPMVVKSKIFLFHSISCLMFIIFFFISYKLKLIELYSKYHTIEILFVDFYFSIIIPMNICLKNPSLRKYLWNDILKNLCW